MFLLLLLYLFPPPVHHDPHITSLASCYFLDSLQTSSPVFLLPIQLQEIILQNVNIFVDFIIWNGAHDDDDHHQVAQKEEKCFHLDFTFFRDHTVMHFLVCISERIECEGGEKRKT